MSVWSDVRNVKDFACVSVPEEIDYSLAEFSSFKEVLQETLVDGKRLGVVGGWDIPEPIMSRVRAAVDGMQVVNADDILNNMRLIKSEAENRLPSRGWTLGMHRIPGARGQCRTRQH